MPKWNWHHWNIVNYENVPPPATLSTGNLFLDPRFLFFIIIIFGSLHGIYSLSLLELDCDEARVMGYIPVLLMLNCMKMGASNQAQDPFNNGLVQQGLCDSYLRLIQNTGSFLVAHFSDTWGGKWGQVYMLVNLWHCDINRING